ncbi:MAG TPA: magnesium/cobalt transporter CorA [Capsulimonadaceae bacterium]|nr:magnesium/cobalt transporter CorA [Capsulimonadaceae bacterium]
MLTCKYYAGNGEAPADVAPADISNRLTKGEGVLWVDISKPEEGDFEMLAREFEFHPLAIEDLKQRDQRPKVVEYGGYVFVVAHELRPAPGREKIESRCVEQNDEVHAFTGSNYVVTVHTGRSESIAEARKRWEANGAMQGEGPFYLLYLILDSLVDAYYPALDAFDDRIDDLERLVLEPADRDVSALSKEMIAEQAKRPLRTLLDVRRELLEARRYVAPLRDAINVLLRRVEALGADPNESQRRERARALFAYFQDVYDHTIRIVDTIDTYRDLLSGTLDAHLAVASNRLNEIVKVLTSVSIILMSWATISGIYGMNFTNMPELHWRYGYPYAIGLMFVIGVIEWLYFRQRKWI